MKFEMTQKGVFLKGSEAPVGAVVEYDSMPGFLVGKCRALPDDTATEGKPLVVASPGTEETPEEEERRLRDEYHELTGDHIGGNAGLETVRRKHAEAMEAK